MTTSARPVAGRASNTCLAPRLARSALVVVVFVATAGLLVWLWQSMHRSSAAFGDHTTIGPNRLAAGTVDLAVGETSAMFGVVDMAPGDVAHGRLVLVNEGTLPLRFRITTSSSGGLLGELLDLTAWSTESDCGDAGDVPVERRWSPLDAASASDAGRASSGHLAPTEAHTVCLTARLPVSASNEVQGSSLGVTFTMHAEHDLEAAG